MSRTADNAAVTGLGLYLDPIGVRAGTSSDGRKSQCGAIAQSVIPPAVLLPRLTGERAAADIGCPPDIRGTGQIWPEEARIDPENSNSARFPIAFAWKDIIGGEPIGWRWRTPEGINRRCTAYEAIATVAHRSISAFGSSGEQQVALIVPNSIDETIQDSLLKELRLICPSAPKLLWRPIAAALAWCEEYASHLLAKNPLPGQAIGDLLCLHLGFDGFEHCILKLMPRRHDNELFLLPARTLPQSGATITPNVDVLDQLTECAIGSDHEQLGYRWWKQWCTDFLTRTFAQYEKVAGRSSDPQRMPYPTNDDIENIISSSKSMLQSHKRWVERLASLDVSNVMGVVATGQLASARMGSHMFVETILLQSGITSSSVELYTEGAHARIGELLPRGAAIFARRVALGLPSYLDTIPRVETIVTREGEPVWADLIASIDEYVPGGEEWTHRPDPRELPLSVSRGERNVVLTVWREGSDHVREVDRDLPHPTQEETSVELEISMFPGQGNPTVEVKPLRRGALGSRRLYLDWSRSEEKPYGKQEALDREERTNPPFEPRQASLSCWQVDTGELWMNREWVSARRCCQSVLDLYRKGRASALLKDIEQLRKSLRETDPTYSQHTPAEHASAVSSMGTLHPWAEDQEFLPELIDALVDLASRHRDPKIYQNALRCLGNCSTSDKRVGNMMHGMVQRERRPQDAEFWLIGGCLRNPTDIGEFASNFHSWLDIPNNPLRALARILQYRENAAEKIPSDTAKRITEKCFAIALKELASVRRGEKTRLWFIYRHASLCIVFMLRRRKYDPDFLPPESNLGLQIKDLFGQVLHGLKSRELEAVGGFVDPIHVTKLMIDYIDKRGRGRLGVAAD